MTEASGLPDELASIRDDFLALPPQERLQLLLEFSNDLPPLPAEYDGHPELFEQVVECQSPVFIAVEVDEQGRFHLHATAPREAPTTRGFASILAHGLDGLTPDEVFAVPADFPDTIGLTNVVSLLRVRGMTGMLGRAKRLLREHLAA
ncbi:MAG: SufE family protein [Microbacterium sp.]|nr:SufE family protein [Microbacterium sp.]